MGATFTDGTTAGVVTRDVIPQLGVKIIQVRVPAAFVWGTDIISVDLTRYGVSRIAGFLAFEETTAGSITIAATGTTLVTAGVLAFTSTGSGANTCGGTLVIFAY
jgi:hypothetical protein